MNSIINLKMMANPLNWGTLAIWLMLIGIATIAVKIVPAQQ